MKIINSRISANFTCICHLCKKLGEQKRAFQICTDFCGFSSWVCKTRKYHLKPSRSSWDHVQKITWFTLELANHFPFSHLRAVKKEVHSLKVYLERLKLLFNFKICTMLSPCPNTANVDELMCEIQEAVLWKEKFVLTLAVVRINQRLHPVKEQSLCLMEVLLKKHKIHSDSWLGVWCIL